MILAGVWIWYTNKNSSYDLVKNQGLASASEQQPAQPPPPQTANNTLVNQDVTREEITKKYMNATLHTNMGDITIEFNNETPQTVANFVKLASANFYDGVKFHRVIKDFMIQGGDPLSKDDSNQGQWGMGGPGYTFPDELNAGNRNEMGTISMANAGPNTNGSQFFINLQNNNFLDTKHTVFGKVTKGLDVVEKIGLTKTGPNDRPVEPIIIKSVTLENMLP